MSAHKHTHNVLVPCMVCPYNAQNGEYHSCKAIQYCQRWASWGESHQTTGLTDTRRYTHTLTPDILHSVCKIKILNTISKHCMLYSILCIRCRCVMSIKFMCTRYMYTESSFPFIANERTLLKMCFECAFTHCAKRHSSWNIRMTFW